MLAEDENGSVDFCPTGPAWGLRKLISSSGGRLGASAFSLRRRSRPVSFFLTGDDIDGDRDDDEEAPCLPCGDSRGFTSAAPLLLLEPIPAG